MTKEPSDTDHFKVGETDRQGAKIERAYITANDYVIYRTELGIRVYVADEHIPDEQRIYYKRLLQIAFERARIESLQPEKLKRVESVCRHVARAIALCLEGNLSMSQEMLKDAEKRLSRLRGLEGRLQYQLSALTTFLVLGILVIITRTENPAPSDLQLYMRIAACGALGGFMSLSLGIRKIDLDPDADWVINSVTGLSRILISIAASFFVFFGIKAGLLLTALDNSSSFYGIYAASVIAGFSESFVPNIIRRVSSEEAGEHPDFLPPETVKSMPNALQHKEVIDGSSQEVVAGSVSTPKPRRDMDAQEFK